MWSFPKAIFCLCLPLVGWLSACNETKSVTNFAWTVSDERASAELKDFCHDLTSRLEAGIMLGHKDALAYGSMWYNQPGRSDVKSVCGNYPAVVDWDLGGIESGSELNVDSIPFFRIRQYVEQVYRRNGVTILSWNPSLSFLLRKDSLQNVDRSVLSGNESRVEYEQYLDRVAVFLETLKNSDGRHIPVIVHLFHSPNLASMDWGMGHCSPEDYVRLWHMTVDYLRNKKNIHHVLYAYSMYGIVSEEEISQYYPGDKYVDIVGLNLYQDFESDESGSLYKQRLNMGLSAMNRFAEANKKLPALTDTGSKGVKISNFFSSILDPVISKYKISYVVFGPNMWNEEESYYIPIPGHPASEDFSKFAHSPHIITCEKADLM